MLSEWFVCVNKEKVFWWLLIFWGFYWNKLAENAWKGKVSQKFIDLMRYYDKNICFFNIIIDIYRTQWYDSIIIFAQI